MPHHTENVKTGAVNWQCHRVESRRLRTMARRGRTRQRVAGGVGGGTDRELRHTSKEVNPAARLAQNRPISDITRAGKERTGLSRASGRTQVKARVLRWLPTVERHQLRRRTLLSGRWAERSSSAWHNPAETASRVWVSGRLEITASDKSIC